MESAAIVQKLEHLHTSPSLHLNTGIQDKVAPAVGKTAFPLIPVFMPRVSRDMIVDSSVPFFCSAQEKRFGMTFDELEASKGGEQAWKAAEPGLAELRDVLKQNKKDDGPFALGSEVSYADFVIVAFMEGLGRIGQDMFERIVGFGESLRKVHEA